MNLQTEKRGRAGSKRKHHPNSVFSGMMLLWASVCVPAPSTGEASFDSLTACVEILVDAARLACFDRDMLEIRKNRLQSSTRVAPTAEKQFGLSSKQMRNLDARPGLAQTPTVVHARIANVSRAAYERQLFVLDNTQSWQQIELDPDFTARNGQEITVSSGALGSFWLSTDAHHRTRVKRIR
jgi:hypothetical protein